MCDQFVVAGRVIAGLAQHSPSSIHHLAKRASTGTIANKSLVVSEFDVIAIPSDRRQTK